MAWVFPTILLNSLGTHILHTHSKWIFHETFNDQVWQWTIAYCYRQNDNYKPHILHIALIPCIYLLCWTQITIKLSHKLFYFFFLVHFIIIVDGLWHTADTIQHVSYKRCENVRLFYFFHNSIFNSKTLNKIMVARTSMKLPIERVWTFFFFT